LEQDPGEKVDLLGKRRQDAAQLRARLTAWEQEVRAER
jgi:hypothetical protein